MLDRSFKIFFCGLVLPALACAQSISLKGWAWSDTIGWISLSCSNQNTCASIQYGLIKNADGTVSGHAWSEHVGWISAEPGDTIGCPLGLCPFYISTSSLATGWMRALSNGGGWDGWISLRDSGYGVEQGSGGLTGWAWGGDVIGWVLFSAEQPCATTAGPFCDGTALKYRDGMCAESVLNPDCGSAGCSSVTNQCVIPTPPQSTLPGGVVLKATPKIVQYGKRSTITWSVVNADSCVVAGNGNTWTSLVGSQITHPINEGATYRLDCTGPGGTLEGKVYIANPPKFREI